MIQVKLRAGKDIARHEFIGLDAKIDVSKNKSLIGLAGRIIDESKNTFILLTEAKERKKVLKEGTRIIFTLPEGDKIAIDADILVARPQDRIRMKIK